MSAPAIDPRQLALPIPRPAPSTALTGCTTCEEAQHLLGADTLANVSIRLGYRTVDNLVAHLNRHGHRPLADRYRALAS